MRTLKIAAIGLIEVTNTDLVLYNRAKIMRLGWKLKKEGHADGISKAWLEAKRQMNNMMSLISETIEERSEYITDYKETMEVAGDLLDMGITGEENMAMKDAFHDMKKLEEELRSAGFLAEIDKQKEEIEKIEAELAFEQFKKEQQRRLKEFLKGGTQNGSKKRFDR